MVISKLKFILKHANKYTNAAIPKNTPPIIPVTLVSPTRKPCNNMANRVKQPSTLCQKIARSKEIPKRDKTFPFLKAKAIKITPRYSVMVPTPLPSVAMTMATMIAVMTSSMTASGSVLPPRIGSQVGTPGMGQDNARITVYLALLNILLTTDRQTDKEDSHTEVDR